MSGDAAPLGKLVAGTRARRINDLRGACKPLGRFREPRSTLAKIHSALSSATWRDWTAPVFVVAVVVAVVAW